MAAPSLLQPLVGCAIAMAIASYTAAFAGGAIIRCSILFSTYAATALLFVLVVAHGAVAPSAYLLAAMFLALSVAAYASSVLERRAWQARRNVCVVRSPFAVRTVVGNGGPGAHGNHHRRVTEQRFAYDLIPGEGEAFGLEVLAPLAGRVRTIRDGVDDVASSAGTQDCPAGVYGNYVVLEAHGRYLFLCHLQKGSIAVREGEMVAAGSVLARCGSSGRSTAPHLHMHVQTGAAATFNRVDGVPIAFQVNGSTIVPNPGEAFGPYDARLPRATEHSDAGSGCEM